MTPDHGSTPPTPPTQPLPPSDDATRVRRDRTVTAETQPLLRQERGRLPFYSAVTCGSLVLALVIGIGGFLGVRGLNAGPSGAPVASDTSPDAPGQQSEPTDPNASSGNATDAAAVGDGDAAGGADRGDEMPEIPTGSEQIQPRGATIAFDAAEAEGYLEVTFGEVTWDADEVIAEANMFNDPPREGHRYLMVDLEATYRGSGTFHAYVWATFEYVAEDGSVHPHTRLVTPDYVSGGHGQLRDGDTFSEQIVFEAPDGSAEGGHFVINGFSQPTEDGTWVDAA